MKTLWHHLLNHSLYFVKVHFLVPFLFLVVACQSTHKSTPKARLPKKFLLLHLWKNYEEILEAILTYNSYINGTIKSEKSKTYIEDRFAKDFIYTAYQESYPPADGIEIRELFDRLSGSPQDSSGFLNQTRDRNTVYIPPAIAHKFSVKDSNKLIAGERFLQSWFSTYRSWHMTTKKDLYLWIIYMADGVTKDGILFSKKQKTNGRLLNMIVLGKLR